MSIVSVDIYKDDEQLTSSTDENAVYSAIETASQNIDASNTRTEWVTTKHLYGEYHLLNGDRKSIDTGSAAYASTSYTLISHGGNSLSITPANPLILRQGDVLRLHSNVHCGEFTLNPVTNNSIFYFTFYWTYDDGGGPITAQIGQDFRNSGQTNGTAADSSAYQDYFYRRHGFSWTYIHTSATPRTVTSLQSRFRWNSAGNSMTLREGVIISLHTRG
jgi:hypothetical protein